MNRALPTAAGCYVISLRPVGEHLELRRAANAIGAKVLALSPWKLQCLDDTNTRAALADALLADRLVFTSPAAVRAALALQSFGTNQPKQYFAIGDSTARALRRAGICEVRVPSRMDSEGLLALSELQSLTGTSIGLITAPGGRNLLTSELQARGARVSRADVYQRVPVVISNSALTRLRTLSPPFVLALSSGEALTTVLQSLASDDHSILKQARVIAASPRLVALAREQGFAEIVLAASTQPRDLIAAIR